MTSLKSNDNFPSHVAIIMDGNGRWAKKHNKPRIEGHKKGADNARNIIELFIQYGIPFITLYVFSTENWNRPQQEVDNLLSLLEENLDSGISIAMEKQARIRHLGKTADLPQNIQQKIKEAVETTRNNTKINVVLAFNYGGRDELVEVVKKIIAGGIKPPDISKELINQHLYSAGIPDPDLIIRTGGEMRLSNFLLWQSAYSEIYFTPVLWPDFNKKELDKALKSYRQRQRRFGRLVEEG